MPTITAITEHPRKPGRFALELDGEIAATLSLDAISTLGLRVGRAVDEALEAVLARETQFTATYDRAINMLASRGRASGELRRLLSRKKEPADAIEHAIERLLAAGLLDDTQFAHQFARSKAAGGAMSRRRIQQELSRRGVAREVADEAIAAVWVEDEIDDRESIDRVARKKLRTLGGADTATTRRRLYGFLARRGYDSEAIRGVVGRLTSGTDEAD